MNDAINAGTLAPCPFCGTAMPRQFCRHDEHGRPSYGFQCIGSGCGICGPEAGDIEESARQRNNRHWDLAQDEDDTLVHQVARSIAEHGVGRPWEDFKPVDAYDLGQSDLIDYARAAIAALPTRANPTPNAPVEPATTQVEWLEDAARYFEARPTLGEDMAHWANVHNAEMCRKIAAILAVRLDEAAIRKDEREKCAKIADTSARLAVEQINLNNAYYERSGSRDAGANDVCRSHQITAEQIAQAIRNGGKQP